MVLIGTGGWAECLLDPVHDEQLANLVPEFLNKPEIIQAPENIAPTAIRFPSRT